MKDRVARSASLIVLGALLLLVIPASSAFAASTIDSVSPSAEPANVTLDVTITGSGFVLQPTVTFGPEINVNSTKVTDLNHLAVNITIAPSAPTGFHTVTASDALGTASCSTCFKVTPPPTVTSISPSTIGLGAGTKHFTINGAGFMNGATVAVSGTGVSPANPAFTNDTKMTIDLTVSPTAITGVRNITVTNPDNQSATCHSCFAVTPAPRVSASGFSPGQRAAGMANQVIDVVGSGFSPGIAATFPAGSGITVNSTTYLSSTNLQMNITTDSGAPLGARNVTFTNADGGQRTCIACFAITGPTTVTIFWPWTVNDPVVASFTQPVSGVASSNSYIGYTGTTTTVPSTVSCVNVNGIPTGCSSGNARYALLRPTSPLVPGQYYTVTIAATGAPAVKDFGGLTVAQHTNDFRGGLIQQGEGAATAATWRTVNTRSALGGSYTVDHLAGATATYSFSGSSITWFTNIGRNYGIADLYVDGVAKAAVNCYRSTTANRAGFTISGLRSGKHSLVIRVRGVKGSSAGTGSDIAIDAFRTGSTTTASPKLAYTWGIVRTSRASGGTYARSDERGSTASFRFRGTRVEWDTVTGPGMGMARVYIDGVFKGTVNNYSSITHYNVARVYSGLSDAMHTITIVVTGTHQAASTGSVAAIDRWVVS
jgi:hypothetical protein